MDNFVVFVSVPPQTRLNFVAQSVRRVFEQCSSHLRFTLELPADSALQFLDLRWPCPSCRVKIFHFLEQGFSHSSHQKRSDTRKFQAVELTEEALTYGVGTGRLQSRAEA